MLNICVRDIMLSNQEENVSNVERMIHTMEGYAVLSV